MFSKLAISGTDLSVPEGAVSLLRDLVHDRTGLFYDDDRAQTMLDKLTPLARERGCHSLLDYYYLLKYEEEGKVEWEQVADALSVQETYFWREMEQVRALVDNLTPAWFAKTSKPLRIWSAACATGEEPFTIAMALEEAGWFERAPIDIVASDVSGSALEKARRGVYRERSFRTFPPELKAKYFQTVPQGWCIAPKLLARVRFYRANLVAPEEIAPFAASPVIFCRNVFIYFSQDAIRRTIRCFAASMPAGGHLCVAASESLLKLTTDFDLREIGNAFVYVKNANFG